MTFRPPSHTQTPNELFALLPQMGEAELKATLVIIRDTFGWQAGGAATVRSLTELQELTGLSRQGVLDGLNAGQARGTLYKTRGSGTKSAYGLVVHDGSRSAELTGQLSRPELVNSVDRTGQDSRPLPVNSVDQGSQPSRPLPVNSVDRSTPDAAAPSAGKTGAERQTKDNRERKERKRTTADRQSVGRPDIQDVELAQQGSTSGADAPSGADGVGATPVTGSPQPPAGQTGQATSTADVPPAGAALAALTSALAGLRQPVAELIAEYPDRQGWLELPAERIRTLQLAARLEHGGRYRGALIEALDAEVRSRHLQAVAPSHTPGSPMARRRFP